MLAHSIASNPASDPTSDLTSLASLAGKVISQDRMPEVETLLRKELWNRPMAEGMGGDGKGIQFTGLSVHSFVVEEPEILSSGCQMVQKHVIDVHGMSGQGPTLLRIKNYKPFILIRIPTGVSFNLFAEMLQGKVGGEMAPMMTLSREMLDEYFNFGFGRKIQFLRVRALNTMVAKRVVKMAREAFSEAWAKVEGEEEVQGITHLSSALEVQRHKEEKFMYPVRFSKDLEPGDLAYHFMVENDFPLCSSYLVTRYTRISPPDSIYSNVVEVEWDRPFWRPKEKEWVSPLRRLAEGEKEVGSYKEAICLSYDIETWLDKTNPEKRRISTAAVTGDSVMCIGLSVNRIGEKKPLLIASIGLDDHRPKPTPWALYITCRGEKELLRTTFRLMRSIPYAFCATFNGDSFDHPYLYVRAQKYGIEEEACRAYDTYIGGDLRKRVQFRTNLSFKMDGLVMDGLSRMGTSQKILSDARLMTVKKDPKKLQTLGLRAMMALFRVTDWEEKPMSKTDLHISGMYWLWSVGASISSASGPTSSGPTSPAPIPPPPKETEKEIAGLGWDGTPEDANRLVMEYNAWDAVCNHALLFNRNFYNDVLPTAEITNTLIADSANQADGMREIQMLSIYARRYGVAFTNVLPPPEFRAPQMSGVIGGGEVRAFAKGIVRNVFSLDYGSQYPSQKRGSNIGSTSKVPLEAIAHPSAYDLVQLRHEEFVDFYCTPKEADQRTRPRYFYTTKENLPAILESIRTAGTEGTEGTEAGSGREVDKDGILSPPLSRKECLAEWKAGRVYMIEGTWAESNPDKKTGQPGERVRSYYVQSRRDASGKGFIDDFSIQAVMLTTIILYRGKIKAKMREVADRIEELGGQKDDPKVRLLIDELNALLKSLDCIQDAAKRMANSEYGAGANEIFPMFDKIVSATVTWCSRRLAEFLRRLLACPRIIVPEWILTPQIKTWISLLSDIGFRLLPASSDAVWRDAKGNVMIDSDILDERKELVTRPGEEVKKGRFEIRTVASALDYQDTDSNYYQCDAVREYYESRPEIVEKVYAGLPIFWDTYFAARARRLGERSGEKGGEEKIPSKYEKYLQLPEVVEASRALEAWINPKSPSVRAEALSAKKSETEIEVLLDGASAWAQFLTPISPPKSGSGSGSGSAEKERWMGLNSRPLLRERMVTWRIIDHNQLYATLVSALCSRPPISVNCDGAYTIAYYSMRKKQYFGVKCPFEKTQVWTISSKNLSPHLSDWDKSTFIWSYLEANKISMKGFLPVRRETPIFVSEALLHLLEKLLTVGGDYSGKLLALARSEIVDTEAALRCLFATPEEEEAIVNEIKSLSADLEKIDLRIGECDRAIRTLKAAKEDFSNALAAKEYYSDCRVTRESRIRSFQAHLTRWREIRELPAEKRKSTILAIIRTYAKQQKRVPVASNDVAVIVERLRIEKKETLIPEEFTVTHFVSADRKRRGVRGESDRSIESGGSTESDESAEKIYEGMRGSLILLDEYAAELEAGLESLPLDAKYYSVKLSKAFANLLYDEAIHQEISVHEYLSTTSPSPANYYSSRAGELRHKWERYEKAMAEEDDPMNKAITKEKTDSYAAVREAAAEYLISTKIKRGLIEKALANVILPTSQSRMAMQAAYDHALDTSSSVGALASRILTDEMVKACRSKGRLRSRRDHYYGLISAFGLEATRLRFVSDVRTKLEKEYKSSYEEMLRAYGALVVSLRQINPCLCSLILNSREHIRDITVEALLDQIPSELRGPVTGEICHIEYVATEFRERHLERVAFEEAVRSFAADQAEAEEGGVK